MSDPKTAVAFAYVGGGTRARISQQFTKLFLNQWGVAQEDFASRVDLFAGSSAGGLQALGYAFNQTPDDLDDFILNDSKRIFTTRAVPIGCDAANDSFRPSFAAKIGLILLNEPFYRSICRPGDGDSNWGDNILKSSMEEIFGTSTMSQLTNKTLITAYDDEADTPIFFSNIQGYPFTGANESIVDVAMCTSAAPVYLPSYQLNGRRYIDGGIFLNNPVQMAYTALKATNPTANRYVVISIGTGLEPNELEGNPSTPEDTSIQRLYTLFNKASFGNQQTAVINMLYEANATLDQLHYYHFDVEFPVGFDSELDQSTPAYFSTLDAITQARFIEDNAAIADIISRLEA